MHNLSDLLMTDVRKGSILGYVLPDEPIYILNGPLLPREGELGELGTVLLSAFRRNKRGLKTVPISPPAG